MQMAFCPIHHFFEWTDDNWYAWDSKAAHAKAKKERDAKAAELKRQGKTVKKWSSKGLMTRGGAGTGKPQIENWATTYYLEVE